MNFCWGTFMNFMLCRSVCVQVQVQKNCFVSIRTPVSWKIHNILKNNVKLCQYSMEKTFQAKYAFFNFDFKPSNIHLATQDPGPHD